MLRGFPTIADLEPALADPNADRIVFWDDSASRFDFLTASTGLSISGTTLSVSVSSFSFDDLANTSLADPNADRIVFWDDSAGQFVFLTPSTGINISGTNLVVSLASFTTTNLDEGSNLYYTQARFDSAFALKTLDDLANTTLPDANADRIVFWDDSAGVYTNLVPNTGISISGTDLNVSVSSFGLDDLANTDLADPNADRFVFWDDSAGNYAFLTPSSTFSISGTSLSLVDASTSVKGIASFNSTNFSVSAGAVNTIQNIATTSTPTFGGLTLTGLSGVLKAATGVVSGSAGLTDLANTSLADPNADKIVFWDDSAGAFVFLEPNDGLSITTTNLNVDVTSPIQISGGSVGLNLTTTYGWTGAHTWGSAGVGVDLTAHSNVSGDKLMWDVNGASGGGGLLLVDGNAQLQVVGKSAFGGGTMGGTYGHTLLAASTSISPADGETAAAMEFNAELSTANPNNGIYGFQMTCSTTGTVSNLLDFSAYEGIIAGNHSSGTNTKSACFNATATFGGAGTGITTRWAAFRANAPTVSGHTLTNAYGFYMPSAFSGATTNWAIWIKGNNSRFGDDNARTYYGTADNVVGDAYFTFNGTNFVCSVAAVTSSARFVIQDAGLIVNEDGNDSDTRIESDGDANCVVVDASTNSVSVGVAAGSHVGKLHVSQPSTTGAKPVLHVQQVDVSEEFIRFTGESADDNSQSLIDAANLATPGSIAGWLKINVQDVKASGAITDGNYWIPFYNTPTA